MNAPQITAVPAVGKTVAGGANPTAESLPAAGDESFSKHLKLHQSSQQNPAKGAEGEPQALSQDSPEASETPGFGQFSSELLPAAVKSLTDSVEQGAVAAEYVEDGEAVLQQLAERIQSGEEVAVSSTQPLPDNPATTAVKNQLLAANNGLPVTGNNLPQSGDSLPPVNFTPAAAASPVTGEAVAKPLPQTADQGLLKAAQNAQQELPAKITPELQISAQQGDKAAVDGGRFAAALGAASEAVGQPASGGSSPLAASVTSPGLATPTSGSAETAVPRPVISMNTPLGQPGWTQEVGSRLQLMVERGNQRAEIRLNPPELGSIEVKVMNDGDRTNVTFFAQNATTREALEAALPRLREMFGDNGLQLADANVSQQQTMAGERDSGQHSGNSEFATADGATDDAIGPAVVRSVNGLVDTYI